jgi:hypothetical protein
MKARRRIGYRIANRGRDRIIKEIETVSLICYFSGSVMKWHSAEGGGSSDTLGNWAF